MNVGYGAQQRFDACMIMHAVGFGQCLAYNSMYHQKDVRPTAMTKRMQN